jgi:hypothetical protein
MPSNRPNLILDEQSFQDLLSAAFTIQAHNDQIKQARLTRTEPEASGVFRQGSAPKPAEESPRASCGETEFRPGERLQRNWASMWLMSQGQGLWPERSSENRGDTQQEAPPSETERRLRAQAARNIAGNGLRAVPMAREFTEETTTQKATAALHDRGRGKSALDDAALDRTAAESKWTNEGAEDGGTKDRASEEFAPEDSELSIQPFPLSANYDSYATGAGIEVATDETADVSGGATSSLRQHFRDLRATLSFHRADLYLGAAILVAAMALLWPAAGSPRPAALGPFERALVALGIAEAPPPPVVHLQGDPSIEVWVDPHSALYYCLGEEQYGKTVDGRVTTQREAQMDRFQPASRSACE